MKALQMVLVVASCVMFSALAWDLGSAAASASHTARTVLAAAGLA